MEDVTLAADESCSRFLVIGKLFLLFENGR